MVTPSAHKQAGLAALQSSFPQKWCPEHTNICIYTYTDRHMHMHTYVDTHICTHTYTHMHAHTDTDTYTHMHTQIHTHVHTHTRTRRHTQRHTTPVSVSTDSRRNRTRQEQMKNKRCKPHGTKQAIILNTKRVFHLQSKKLQEKGNNWRILSSQWAYTAHV